MFLQHTLLCNLLQKYLFLFFFFPKGFIVVTRALVTILSGQQFSAKLMKQVKLWCIDKHSYHKIYMGIEKDHSGFLFLQCMRAASVPVFSWTDELSPLFPLFNKHFF